MVKEIRIYIEGDTRQKGKNTDISLRQGFNFFFRSLSDKAKEVNIPVRPITYGSKYETFKKFLDGAKEYRESFVLFLVDSDSPVGENEAPKSFLQKQNPNWHLQNTVENQCHLMVQTMESWFLADKDLLAEFYGQHFNRNAFPKNTNVEEIAKVDVESGLANATRKTRKGMYHKTRHGAKLLELIDPQKVCDSAPHCKRLFETISQVIGQAGRVLALNAIRRYVCLLRRTPFCLGRKLNKTVGEKTTLDRETFGISLVRSEVSDTIPSVLDPNQQQSRNGRSL